MIDNISDIQAFYDGNVEKEDTRLVRHPVERDVTWRYLDKYLPASGIILDVGAATGVYTIPLAEKGFSVTAADLSPVLIEQCKKSVREKNLGDKVTCMVADARDLSGISETDYDAVLVFGPLYHLVEEEDRKLALNQALAKLKPGGIIFSSHISRYGFWSDILLNLPELIEYEKDVQSVLDTGRDLVVPSWESEFRAYFNTVPETISLHEGCGCKTITIAGLEPAGETADSAYKILNEKQRKLWLDLMFRISAEPSIVGASSHLLYVGEKAG